MNPDAWNVWLGVMFVAFVIGLPSLVIYLIGRWIVEHL
jgi:hypothetical protein